MRVDALLVVLGLSLACAGVPDPSPPPAAAQTAPVSDDLAALTTRLLLPDGATAARWAMSPLGVQNPRVPGPTDYRLVAWVEIDPARWETVEASYGEARPSRGGLVLSPTEADLLPAASRPPPEADGSIRLDGDAYRPDRAARPGWHVSSIRRVGDAGLWFVAISS